MQNQFELYPVQQSLSIKATPKMIETLKKCYQMELAFPGKPYGPKDFKGSHFLGLYKRELLDVDFSNTKLTTARWFITSKGLRFLVLLATKRLPVNDPLLINNMTKLQYNLKVLQNSVYNLQITSGRINKKSA